MYSNLQRKKGKIITMASLSYGFLPSLLHWLNWGIYYRGVCLSVTPRDASSHSGDRATYLITFCAAALGAASWSQDVTTDIAFICFCHHETQSECTHR